LARSGIKIFGYIRQVGSVKIGSIDFNEISKNPLFCPDRKAAEEMKSLIEKVRSQKDSIGALVEVKVQGVPPGIGEPVFDKLDSEIAKALMSINAVKGVEIGAGFQVVEMRGSENCDPITPAGFKTNHAGGILGGISNGDEIIARLAIKPTSSIALEQDTIDNEGRPAKIMTKGRHDPCVGIRAVPIAEAMMALVLVDFLMRNKLVRIKEF